MILKTAFRHNRCAAELSRAGSDQGIRVEVVSLIGDAGQPRATVAEDFARMKANPTYAELHFRFVRGYWPEWHQIEMPGQRRRQIQPEVTT